MNKLIQPRAKYRRLDTDTTTKSSPSFRQLYKEKPSPSRLLVIAISASTLNKEFLQTYVCLAFYSVFFLSPDKGLSGYLRRKSTENGRFRDTRNSGDAKGILWDTLQALTPDGVPVSQRESEHGGQGFRSMPLSCKFSSQSLLLTLQIGS